AERLRRRLVAGAGDVEIGAEVAAEDAERIEPLRREVDAPLVDRARDEEDRLRLDESDQLVVERFEEFGHIRSSSRAVCPPSLLLLDNSSKPLTGQRNLAMQKFETLTGVAAPIEIDNVDTDMIIPKQYLKTIKR